MTKLELKQIRDSIQAAHAGSVVRQQFAKLLAHIYEQEDLIQDQKKLVNRLESMVQSMEKANEELRSQLEDGCDGCRQRHDET